MNPCGICGCEETKIRDEDYRNSEGGGFVDRYFICAKCGVTRGIGLIMPHDGNWDDFIIVREEQ